MIGKVDQIKDRLDIRTALQQFTSADLSKLKGEKGNIPCPFHADREPSFLVDTTDNHWHCFAGCGHGDVISLYATARGIGNTEAIHELAGLLGIADAPVTPEQREEFRRIKAEKEIMASAQEKVETTYRDLSAILRKMREYEAAAKGEEVWLLSSVFHAMPKIEYVLDCLLGNYGEDDLVYAYFEAKEVIKTWADLI